MKILKKILCEKYARRLEGTYEGNHLMTGINKYKKSPYMYSMAKVHKKVPTPQMALYRPVKSEWGSPYVIMSKY